MCRCANLGAIFIKHKPQAVGLVACIVRLMVNCYSIIIFVTTFSFGVNIRILYKPLAVEAGRLMDCVALPPVWLIVLE